MTKNYCFKSDGTSNTGGKIIKALVFLGGVNYDGLIGNSKNAPYYFIRKNGKIDLSEKIPEDCKPMSH